MEVIHSLEFSFLQMSGKREDRDGFLYQGKKLDKTEGIGYNTKMVLKVCI